MTEKQIFFVLCLVVVVFGGYPVLLRISRKMPTVDEIFTWAKIRAVTSYYILIRWAKIRAIPSYYILTWKAIRSGEKLKGIHLNARNFHAVESFYAGLATSLLVSIVSYSFDLQALASISRLNNIHAAASIYVHQYLLGMLIPWIFFFLPSTVSYLTKPESREKFITCWLCVDGSRGFLAQVVLSLFVTLWFNFHDQSITLRFVLLGLVTTAGLFQLGILLYLIPKEIRQKGVKLNQVWLIISTLLAVILLFFIILLTWAVLSIVAEFIIIKLIPEWVWHFILFLIGEAP